MRHIRPLDLQDLHPCRPGESQQLHIRQLHCQLDRTVIRRMLVPDRLGGIEPRADRAGCRLDPDSGLTGKAGEPLRHDLRQQVEAQTFLRRNPYRRRLAVGIAIDPRLELQAIDLVVDQDLRNSVGANLGQHAVDLRNVLLAPRVTRVDDMQQKRRLARFREC